MQLESENEKRERERENVRVCLWWKCVCVDFENVKRVMASPS